MPLELKTIFGNRHQQLQMLTEHRHSGPYIKLLVYRFGPDSFVASLSPTKTLHLNLGKNQGLSR